jgi:hypothetical protein
MLYSTIRLSIHFFKNEILKMVQKFRDRGVDERAQTPFSTDLIFERIVLLDFIHRLVFMRYLCFPGFNSCEVCSGWVICCPLCLSCFKCLCCVCTQVSGSVVSNWPLCEFWTCVLWFFGIYIYISQFFETPDDGWSPKAQFVQYQHTIVRILQKLFMIRHI